MSDLATNERKNRDQLIVERNRLFSRFLENPVEIGLALEIKVIDDQVAACNERIRAEEKKAQLREKNTARPH